MKDVRQIKRENLYELVWSKPTITVAEEFGISDVAVAKICKKLDVPKPKLGYWAKKQHGKRVRQTPLPPLKEGTPETYAIHPTSSDRLPEEVQNIIDQQNDFEKDESNQITVKETLRSAHPFIHQSLQRPNRPHTDQYKRLYLGLNVSVGRDSSKRALRIMDALIKALEKRGFQVSLEGERKTSVNVEINDQQLAFGITESVKRIERTDKNEYRWGREWYYIPTGKLILEIKERFHGQKVIRDGKSQQLEECLNRFIVLLVQAAELIKIRKAEHEVWLLKWEKEREIEQIAQRKRKLDKVRTEELLKSSMEWQQCQMMRVYVSAVKDQAETLSDHSGVEEWLAWAGEKVGALESKLLRPELMKLDSISTQHFW